MSLTIQGVFGLAILSLLKASGLHDVVAGDIDTFLVVGGQIITAIMIYVGRVRQGDINWYGVKKTN